MTIGQKIYELRQEKNVSQETMAFDLEVSRQAVSKWETDQSIPDLDKIIKIAKYFNVTVDSLVSQEPIEKVNLQNELIEGDFEKKLRLERDNRINVFKRLAKLFFNSSIWIRCVAIVIVITLIIFQRIYINFEYDSGLITNLKVVQFIIPVGILFRIIVFSIFYILMAYFLEKKLLKAGSKIGLELVTLLIVVFGSVILDPLTNYITSTYLNEIDYNSVNLKLYNILANYINQVGIYFNIATILIVIATVISIVCRFVKPEPYKLPKAEDQVDIRLNVVSLLIGIFSNVTGLAFMIPWLNDLKQDQLMKRRMIKMWYFIGLGISFSIIFSIIVIKIVLNLIK